MKSVDALAVGLGAALALVAVAGTNAKRACAAEPSAGPAAEAAVTVEASARRGDALWLKGDDAGAHAAYRDAVDAFDRVRLAPGTPVAEHAARARFMLAEEGLPAYEAIRLDAEDKKALAKDLDSKATSLKAMEASYEDVRRFGVGKWIVASHYRVAYLYDVFAAEIRRVRNPFTEPCARKGGVYCDAEVEYGNALDDMVAHALDKALDAYQVTLDKAAALGVKTTWSRLAEAALARRPAPALAASTHEKAHEEMKP